LAKDGKDLMKDLTKKDQKITGAHYTPTLLANFVAEQIMAVLSQVKKYDNIRVLDPAVGDGELLISILQELSNKKYTNIEVIGFDTNRDALNSAKARIKNIFPNISLCLRSEDFLYYSLNNHPNIGNLDLFKSAPDKPFDIVIANPPYVRTQVMGSIRSQTLAKNFGLSGRIDLYHAFILAISRVLRPGGIAGIIVSNRFMTTKTGAFVRQSIIDQFDIIHVWDLGDTRLFQAAVLPAVLILKRKKAQSFLRESKFTSIYSTSGKKPNKRYKNIIEAIKQGNGVIEVNDGAQYYVKNGRLNNDKVRTGVWRITTEEIENWLAKIKKNTCCTFRDIGRIRVGVKTTADRVFIRSDWESLPEEERPELLRSLITHHAARRFKAIQLKKEIKILYPHMAIKEKRVPININDFPRSDKYLNKYRSILEKRDYLIKAGRKWYEIWVPQDPEAWKEPKLVFWDIAKKPTFWIDLTGSVVNGDCYWICCEKSSQKDLLWLALAIGNSAFIEEYYDAIFHNKLYAGRRRFITQYVEKFPLPNPSAEISRRIIQISKEIYKKTPSSLVLDLEKELNQLVLKAFGLGVEKILR